MKDVEIRSGAYQILKEAQVAMTFNVIADILGSECDPIALEVNLQELSRRGVITKHVGDFGRTMYQFVREEERK